MLEFEDTLTAGARIKVVGAGGAGGNAVNTMIDAKLDGVDFIVCNTDVQALQRNQAATKVQLGEGLTRGLGAGGDPERGRAAAMEDKDRMMDLLAGAEMVFVTAGMGGGTGTGASPVIAECARSLGALTVGVVTKPFFFEGTRRRRLAEAGIKELRQSVDTLITIPNDKLLKLAGETMSFLDGLKKADEVLLNAVRGISDVITVPGLINVDFADVHAVMHEMGMALMGIGVGEGESRALDAAQAAISSPLLDDVTIDGATGVLINISGAKDLTMKEVVDAAMLIQDAAAEDAAIYFGAVIDDTIGRGVKVTVVATGFDEMVEQVIASTGPRPVPRRRNPSQPGRRTAAVTQPGLPGLRKQVSSPDDDAWDMDVPTFLRRQE